MTAAIGEMTYIKSVLVNTHVFGVVTDGDVPDGFSATFEITGDQGVLVVPALQGDQGVPGQDAFALRLQVSTIDDPLDLPETLTADVGDIGKYWMIDDVDADGNVVGSSAYIWFGDHYRRMMMGSAGPVGATPNITPSFNLGNSTTVPTGTRIDVTGDVDDPNWAFWIDKALIQGPPGPSATLASCPDIDISTPLTIGSLLGWDGTMDAENNYVFKFLSPEDVIPQPITVPEAAFTSYEGISSRATVGTFQCPSQPFAWKPWVFGQIFAAGLELDADPLTIGAEVRLGDPTTGQLVARGFGNELGQVTLIPHTSDPSTPTNSMTPSNSYALVPANNSDPALSTLYVNLYNDGVVGVYQFAPKNAQLALLQIPTPAAVT